MIENSKGRLGIGIALSIFGLTLFFIKPQPLNSFKLNSTIADEPVNIQGFDENNYKEEDIPVRIMIPEISIDLEVQKARIINGFWEVFKDKAAWGEGSGIPGRVGNQVVFAHAREGLFLPLKDIKKDMELFIFTKDKWYSYKVTEIKEVYPNQVEVIKPTEDETLTLYTCSGYKDFKRLVVVAKRS